MIILSVCCICRLELVIEQLDDLREDVLKREEEEEGRSSPSLVPASPGPHSAGGGIDSKLNQILSLLQRRD